MIGQYTLDELLEKGHFVSSSKQQKEGLIVRRVGATTNYYCRESDGSWTNYDCKSDGLALKNH